MIIKGNNLYTIIIKIVILSKEIVNFYKDNEDNKDKSIYSEKIKDYNDYLKRFTSGGKKLNTRKKKKDVTKQKKTHKLAKTR